MMEYNYCLALYDFASKQEFIYRTSKIREISGASALLAGIFKKFPKMLGDKVNMKYDFDQSFTLEGFAESNIDAEALYDGGGSLMVLFKSKDKYIEANRLISENILINYPSLSLIVCCAPFGGNFKEDRAALYAESNKRKNFYPASDLSAVTPMSQIDPMTFLPVTRKKAYPYEQSLSADRVAKQSHFNPKEEDKLENLEGMTAVIYIDGNAMGQRLKKCESEDYNNGVAMLRSFSENVNRLFVVEPLKAISEAVGDTGYRQVIGGGDEITIICKAEKAWELVCKYFEILRREPLEITNAEGVVVDKSECNSCAGIAVFHSKMPFSIAYEIAEAACESAKEKSRIDNKDYVDFYFCHAGVTNDFKTLREAEQKHATARPYSVSEAIEIFTEKAPVLQNAERSNVKSLGSAAQESYERYLLEVKRVNAYLPQGSQKLMGTEEEMKVIYDMAEFYDLWFTKEGKTNEKDS